MKASSKNRITKKNKRGNNPFVEKLRKMKTSLTKYFEEEHVKLSCGWKFKTEYNVGGQLESTQWMMSRIQLGEFCFRSMNYQSKDETRVTSANAEKYKNLLIEDPKKVFCAEGEIASIRYFLLKKNATRVYADKELTIDVSGGRWYQMSKDESPIDPIETWIVNSIRNIHGPGTFKRYEKEYLEEDPEYSYVAYLESFFDPAVKDSIQKYNRELNTRLGCSCKIVFG